MAPIGLPSGPNRTCAVSAARFGDRMPMIGVHRGIVTSHSKGVRPAAGVVRRSEKTMNHHSQGGASAQRERPYVPGVSLRRRRQRLVLPDGWVSGERPKGAQAPLRGGLRGLGGGCYLRGGGRHRRGDEWSDRGGAGGVPRKFVNSGTGRARHIDIHTSPRMTTE